MKYYYTIRIEYAQKIFYNHKLKKKKDELRNNCYIY